jgi:hypothetical protein
MSDRTPLDLSQVLADAREEATVLDANRATFSVARVREILKAVEVASEEWLTWLSETDAAIRSGYSVDWLRARFPGWERDGHARLQSRARQYRAVVIPRRANTAAAAARGREAARSLRRAS